LQIASQIADYQNARTTTVTEADAPKLADYKDVELLSTRDKEILVASLKKHNIELAVKTAALFFIIAIGTIFLTHKVAGPLYRFQKTFEAINEGDLKQRIYLRKNDHARELLPSLNAMLSSLDYSLSKIKVLKQKIFDGIDAGTISSEDLKHYRTELESELNRYQTSDAYTI
jgi:methyl-accepting chemotaxis protein